MIQTVLTNARLVLPDQVISGSVVMCGGDIVDVQPGRSQAPGALDFDGDTLIAGIVDLHTDNLERQVKPRSTARWPSRSAMMMHDAQCAAAGITTVLDALCVGDVAASQGRVRTFRDAVVDLDALADTGLLKSEHYLHLRCELPAADMMQLFVSVAEHPRVRMISLMDHSPGVGQYTDLEQFRELRRREDADEATIERRIHELAELRGRWREPNRRGLLARVAGRDVALASHDDRSVEDVAQNDADGIHISEFPVTLAAARAARARGLAVIAGAPNIVRGGSHFGNVAACDLVRADAVNAFASDYVPASLVEAAFICADSFGLGLPAAIALIAEHPARIAGLPDRGRLAVGLRADLVRIRLHEKLPVVRQVWRGGERVA
jgi:alpha-D-ribose 1-methylphosphonate 5-triphosphate diphosphatase